MRPSKKALRDRYPVNYSAIEVCNVRDSLMWTRKLYAGKIDGYDPTLGDRPSGLRRDLASYVIRLVLWKDHETRIVKRYEARQSK